MVEIVVLLKQVPDTEATIRIDEDEKTIKTEDIKWVINPYDEYAVEEALRIRESQGEGKVTIVTVGQKRAVESIRTALAMGADEGVLINDPATEGSDGLGIAKILAAALKDIPHDVILAGMRAVDDDGCLVPAAVAEFLGLPQISMVVKQDIEGRTMRCERTVEGGSLVVEADLPALFTTQKGINEPRYASLPGIMKAKKKKLEEKTLADIGLATDSVGQPAAKSNVTRLSFPPQREAGKIVDGETPEEKAAELVKLLREEAKVI